MTESFEQLIAQYDHFKKEQKELKNDEILAKAQDLLIRIKDAGEFIIELEHRSILENIARDLGETIFKLSDKFPSVRLAPPSSNSLEKFNKFLPVQREDRSSNLPKTSNREKWLRQLKFRLDPFEYPDGSRDPNLAQYFYRRPEFPEILGNVSKLEPVFVFGVPGSGKSSLRNAIAQICRAENILPVVYDNLKPLLDESGPPDNQVEQHVKQILKVALETLATQIEQQSPSLPKVDTEDPIIGPLRKCLWAYVSKYEANLFRKQLWKTFLAQNEETQEGLPTESRELIGHFCQCVTALLGYRSIYFLVDPDEDILPDVNVVWRLLVPLLTDYYLLDLTRDRATFKFFLNSAFLSLALNIPWISRQQNRGIYKIYHLDWSIENLLALLRERLRLCSERIPPYTSLGEFSEVDDVDNMIIQQAEGKPRKLITICNMLFNIHAHAFSDPDHLLITRQEIEETFQQLTITEPDPLAKLIAQGENMQVEFKATMRWYIYAKRVDMEMEKEIARTLCAFMNAEGGTLIIGVDDHGEPVGLEYDFNTLRKKNKDGFEIAFNDLVKTYLELEYRQNIRELDFRNYLGKQICVVEVEKSQKPVYCFEDERKFYVRVGNATRRLDVKSAVEYIQDRFEK